MPVCQCFNLMASPAAIKRVASPSSLLPTKNPAVADEQRRGVLTRPRDQVWIDVHAHPGRCFLAGMAPDDPFVTLLGSDNILPALDDMKEGGVAVACFASVSDLRGSWCRREWRDQGPTRVPTRRGLQRQPAPAPRLARTARPPRCKTDPIAQRHRGGARLRPDWSHAHLRRRRFH